MADKDISTEEENLNQEDEQVETTDADQLEDENSEDEEQEDAKDDAESDDDSDDDSEEDDSDDEEEEPEFKKAFSQIKGETLEEYAPNLEQAYRKSSSEGKRLASEKKDLQDKLDQITAAVAKNPELAKLITDSTAEGAENPTIDPALMKARQDMEDQMAKEYTEFVADHPELDEDEALQEEFLENMKIVGDAARKKGRIESMSVATKKAWAMLGKEDDKKEKIAEAAKNTASKSKTTSKKKTVKKQDSKLTPEQVAYAKKFGLTEKQLLETLSSD